MLSTYYHQVCLPIPDSLLSNDGLKQAIDKTTDPEAKAEMELALAWSEKVNEAIGQIVEGLPPFPYVRESLEKLQPLADAIVVSATPNEALAREWQEHDIAQYTRAICGQELGTKAEHIRYTAGGKYEKGKVLMIGDAPGDLKAARANDALFYPINPGHEEESWQRFFKEGLHKFLNLEFEGAYEASLIAEFEEFMPETPPWQL